MSNMKRYAVLVMVLLMMVSMVLAGCGDSSEPTATVSASGEVEYRVVLTDALGNIYSDGIIVKFWQGDQEIAMQVVGVGFIISVIQDSMETALNSSGDVIFTATAEYRHWQKTGKSLPTFLGGETKVDI